LTALGDELVPIMERFEGRSILPGDAGETQAYFEASVQAPGARAFGKSL